MLARPKYTSKVDIFSFGVLVVHILSGEWPMPSEAFAEDPNDPNGVVLVTELERRRESIHRISEGHPLLGLIEQCLSNVASRRPDAAEVVRQLQAEHVRVPPRPENRLELLQQVQSLRAGAQHSSREENEAVREDMSRKNAEIEFLRQNYSSLQSRYEFERGNFQAQRAALQRDMEALQSELALAVERSRTETESLRAQVQRLTLQPRAPPPETKGIQVRIHYLIHYHSNFGPFICLLASEHIAVTFGHCCSRV